MAMLHVELGRFLALLRERGISEHCIDRVRIETEAGIDEADRAGRLKTPADTPHARRSASSSQSMRAIVAHDPDDDEQK
jgi:hypothetical protein